MEQEPLFDMFTPETVTHGQLLAALNEGVDPNTGEYSDIASDEYGELKWIWRTEETPLGTFEKVTDWNGGDQRPMGIVIRHVETDTYLLAEGTYSSWDGSDFDDWVIAEPYEFTETRYRGV